MKCFRAGAGRRLAHVAGSLRFHWHRRLPLQPRRCPAHHQRDQQLQNGERGCHIQPQHLRGLAVNFDFERGEARATENEHDAEAGEGEQKDERRRGANRRQRHGQRDVPEGLPAVCAKIERGLLDARIERFEEAADQAHHDRDVVEGVRNQDHTECSRDQNGRLVEVEERLQRGVQQAARADQRAEGGGHHHGGHDERHNGDGAPDALAGEAVARKGIGRRQPQRQREQGAERGLPQREPQHLQVLRVAKDGQRRLAAADLAGRETHPPNLDQRPDEEEGEEKQRRQGEQEIGDWRLGIAPFQSRISDLQSLCHLSTSLFHASSHCSRPASI